MAHRDLPPHQSPVDAPLIQPAIDEPSAAASSRSIRESSNTLAMHNAAYVPYSFHSTAQEASSICGTSLDIELVCGVPYLCVEGAWSSASP